MPLFRYGHLVRKAAKHGFLPSPGIAGTSSERAYVTLFLFGALPYVEAVGVIFG
jgi:hypothetical protein